VRNICNHFSAVTLYAELLAAPQIVNSENIFDIVRILQSPILFSHESISFNKKEGIKSMLKADEGILSSEVFGA
jgi:hypothetical protein